MRSGTGILLALLMICSSGMSVTYAQDDGETVASSRSPVERVRALFDRYNRQQIGLKGVFDQLKSWEKTELVSAAEQLLSSDYDQLKETLDPEHLRHDVRSSLQSTLGDKRKRLLNIIRDEQRYNASPRNRSLQKKVARSSVGLFTLFRKPLIYYLQTGASNGDAFFRSVALIRFLRSADYPVPEPGKKLLERIGSAKEIISTSSIGGTVELQPHSRENKNVEKDNKEKREMLTESERELARFVNTYREAFGLRKLLLHEQVSAAARDQSKHMKQIGKLTHQSEEASRKPLLKRLRKNGFSAREAGENVARGDDPPIAVLKGWIQSPAHHRNLLKENYRYMGVAKNGEFWTLDMTTVPRVQDQRSSSK